jgi:CheY-like chemotaxis protein/anti-sigma regulatory factor (Ser/Thr protein kinase)
MYQIAEEARRAKEEFVANVSHELRTPLNMIIGFSDMIVQSPQAYGADLPPALLTDIAAIHRNSQHLSRLVDDVLDLSQVEAGRMALSKKWSSLREIIEEAALTVSALFESKGLYLETELPAELPPVFCDGTRIRQVVINLLSNAGRFTERGGICVNASCRDGQMTVSVADTGPGIAEEDQEKLFEPFQQLDSSVRRRHGGSGLGLSISKRFVDMHEGKMWVESEVGKGTTICFSLPLEAGPPMPAAGDGLLRWFSPYHQYEKPAQRSQAPPPNVVPRYVLLEKGRTMQRLLGRYMHDVELASFRKPEQAVEDLARSPARALVVNASPYEDAPIPERQLLDLPFGTLTISCWVPGEQEAIKRLGVVGYLVKPVTGEKLAATLQGLGEGIESVLLVDDDPEVLQLFGRMLATVGGGYRVLRARTGERALDLLRERRPDVMLLDLFMPGMDGFQVLRAKGADLSTRDIPVVIISARDPGGAPVVSSSLTVTRSGGLSADDLLSCIEAVSEVLAPPERSGPAQTGNRAG